MLNENLIKQIVAIIVKKPGKEELTKENLKEAIERAAIQVSRFCRLRIIPDELRYILADMAADIYDMDTYNPKADAEEDDFSERVKSIKQGDTTIELATEAKVVPCANMAEVMKKYQSDLLPYRGIFWR